ncbi:hypothetical protein ACFFMP_02355 [Pseudoroseomonas cervicalis]|uniref:hypothetical protein n=1 Tax=Teichococcus cervicalis TaxID=204525 RepID=UPI0035F011E2
MSGALSWAGAEPMRRVALRAGGVLVHWWTRVEIVRELGEISGSFMLEYLDTPRARAAFPASLFGGQRGTRRAAGAGCAVGPWSGRRYRD